MCDSSNADNTPPRPRNAGVDNDAIYVPPSTAEVVRLFPDTTGTVNVLSNEELAPPLWVVSTIAHPAFAATLNAMGTVPTLTSPNQISLETEHSFPAPAPIQPWPPYGHGMPNLRRRSFLTGPFSSGTLPQIGQTASESESVRSNGMSRGVKCPSFRKEFYFTTIYKNTSPCGYTRKLCGK